MTKASMADALGQPGLGALEDLLLLWAVLPGQGRISIALIRLAQRLKCAPSAHHLQAS